MRKLTRKGQRKTHNDMPRIKGSTWTHEVIIKGEKHREEM